MPWQEVSTVSLRKEFVSLARQPDANVSELCRRFGISRKTGYKWLARYAAGEQVAERSRRPLHSPRRTAPSVEKALLRLRGKHPQWGARKLVRRLRDLGHVDLPSPSTGQAILRRHGLIAPEQSAKREELLAVIRRLAKTRPADAAAGQPEPAQ